MPLSNLAVLQALRTRLLTLSVVDIIVEMFTVTIDEDLNHVIEWDGGSFEELGFMAGMEVTTDQLMDNKLIDFVVLWVDENKLTIDSPRAGMSTVAIPNAPVRFTVGLPTRREWENIPFDPEDGRWYISEDYLPGTSFLIAGNYQRGELDVYPALMLRLYGLGGTGVEALYTVADKIVNLFPPGLALPTVDTHVLLVRGDQAPSRGQLVAQGAGFVAIPITIPLWVRTFT